MLESRITNTVTVPDFCVMSDEFNVYKICTEVLLNDEHFKACLQKATVSFVMSVCLPVLCPHGPSAPTGWNFMKFDI